MRFYTKHHQFYCGIDLHARTMYVCIMDHEGTILTHWNMPATAETLADVLQPYRKDLVLAALCIFTWYWVADLCSRIGVEFVLGHALYMKEIHGGKVKNDKIDYQKIAALLRSGMHKTLRLTGTLQDDAHLVSTSCSFQAAPPGTVIPTP